MKTIGLTMWLLELLIPLMLLVGCTQEPETVTMRVTAYCPCVKCCGKWADGMTANGHRIAPSERFVAAPRLIPFGTLFVIPGYAGGTAVPVWDRGGSIKGNRLDVYFDTHQEALNWGVQVLKVRKSNKSRK